MLPFFNVEGRATPHFYVNRDGEVEQYIDTDFRSSANLEGNHDCITVESWDGYGAVPWPAGQVPGWTPAQVESLARLAVWCHEEHDVPIVPLPSSHPGTRGIGWHRQGIDGNFPNGLLAGRPSGGERWSESAGKVCPGDNKIRGVVDEIIPRALELLNGDDMPDIADIREIVQNNADRVIAVVRNQSAQQRAAMQAQITKIDAKIDALPDDGNKAELKDLVESLKVQLVVSDDA